MTRILVVNPNASPIATQHIAEGCQPHAAQGTDVTYVTASGGPEAIDTPLDVAIAAIEAARVVAKNRDSYDAFVIAAGDDPGLDIARQITDKPVVGIAEAGMLFALSLGGKFSVVTALRCEIPKTFELVNRYGLSSRLASVIAVESPSTSLTSAALIADPRALEDHVVTEAARAIREDMAEVIVLLGSVMCLLAAPLTTRLEIPVLSGAICALKLAEALAAIGARTSHVYRYATPVKADHLVGYDEFRPFYSGQT